MNNSKKVIPVKKVQSAKIKSKSKSKLIIIASGALVVIIALALVIFKFSSGAETDLRANVEKTANIPSISGTSNLSNTSSIVISKSEITEIAKFYPVVVDGTKMEVLAAKAPDGTIRTA
ncbi:MAG TPA: hypothetical protein VFD03_11385, partial [Clostridia bacterium]|nr:hypothetical protein [Clostridia bacterium]